MSGSLPQRVAARLAGVRDRVELPQLLAGRRVVGADEAAVRTVAGAALQPLNDLAARDDRSAGVRKPLRAIGDGRFPDLFAVARVERDEARVGGRDDQLVLVDRDVAHRAHADLRQRPDFVLPDQLAGAAVERLDDVARVDQIDDAVVDERHGLVRAALFADRPDPGELQILDVVARDLVERAVAPALIVAARHQPVAGGRVAQHRVGHRDVVLHFARHGEPARHRSGCLSAAARGRSVLRTAAAARLPPPAPCPPAARALSASRPCAAPPAAATAPAAGR